MGTAANHTYSHTGVTTSVWAYIIASFIAGAIAFGSVRGWSQAGEKWYEFFFFTIVGGLGIWLLVFLFRLCLAPAEVHEEDMKAAAKLLADANAKILQLSPAPISTAPRLTILFKKGPARHVQIGNYNELLYRVGVILENSISIPRMSCKLLEIVAINSRDGDLKAKLHAMHGCALMRQHIRSYVEEHPLDPGDEKEFDLIQESPDKKTWRLCFGIQNPPDSEIPKGSYKITVIATGTRVAECKKSFFVGKGRHGRLIVNEVRQALSQSASDLHHITGPDQN